MSPATPSSVAKFSDVLKSSSGLIGWLLKTMTSFTSWILGNKLAVTFLSVFIAGVAIAFLLRILNDL